jgi:hypothetical protein
MGSPLLNEYGEVIGVAGSSVMPGEVSVEQPLLDCADRGLGNPYQEALAVSLDLISIPPAETRPTLLEEIARKGQFTSLLVGHRNIMSGTLARDVQFRQSTPEPVDTKCEFSRREGQIAVILTWDPKEKRKSVIQFRAYDLENKVLQQSKATKVTLKPGRIFFSTWKLPIGNMSPGIYRIDAVLGDDPVWRGFFRVVE